MTDIPDGNDVTRRLPRDGNGRGSGFGKIGGYDVVRPLGEGGMGQVLLGHDSELRRHVAIKLVRPELNADQGFIERFFREARLSAALNHPNIVQTYMVGRHDGVPFLVLEYVKGKTLRDLLRTPPPLSPSQILRLIIQCCDGLETAARLGIVHRDIKPANIMVRDDGVVKLMDFGLSKEIGAETLTVGSAVMGTPDYMPPEQSAGRPVDFRADVYALGITMFQCLTGYLPYKSSSILETIRMHAEEPLPKDAGLELLANGRLMRLIELMTAKTPEERPSSYEAIRKELRHLLTKMGDEEASPTKILPSAVEDERFKEIFSPPTPSTRPVKRTSKSARKLDRRAKEQLEGRPARAPWLAIGFLVAVAVIGALAAGWYFYGASGGTTPASHSTPLPEPAPSSEEEHLVPTSARDVDKGPVTLKSSRVASIPTARDLLGDLGTFGFNQILDPNLHPERLPVYVSFTDRTAQDVMGALCLATGWKLQNAGDLANLGPGAEPGEVLVAQSRASLEESKIPIVGINTMNQTMTIRTMCDTFSVQYGLDYLIIGQEVAGARLPSLSLTQQPLTRIMTQINNAGAPIEWTVYRHTLIIVPASR